MTLEGYQQLERRFAAVKVAPKTMLRKVAAASVQEAKHLVRRKTGFTGRSIRVAQVSEESATIVAGGAGVYLEHGTRPHIIRPKNKKALFFASQGITTERFGAGAQLKFRKNGSLSAGSVRRFGNAAFVLTKEVHHPGTKATPFLLPGAQRAVARAGLSDEITSAWNGAA